MEVYSAVVGIPCRQVGVRGKIRKLERPRLKAAEAIILPVAVTIGGEDVLDFVSFAVGVSLGLLHALEGIVTFLLGLEHRDRHRLGHIRDLDTQEIVCTP